MAVGDLITSGFQLELNGVLMGAGTKLQFDGPIEGLGIPDARAVGGPRPSAHGSYPVRQLLPGKAITWTVSVLGDSVDDVITELIKAEAAFAPRDGDELELVIRIGAVAYFLKGQPGPTSPDLTLIRTGTAYLHCQFVVTDPRLYNLEEQTATTALGTSTGGLAFPHAFPHGFGSATPGVMVAVNYGTIETFPTFRITAGIGGLASPGLVVISPFEAVLRILVTLVEGDFLDVDMGERTVTLNGMVSRTNLVNRPDEDDWFAIPGGPGGLVGAELDVQLVGTGAGHATMSWHSATLL